MGVSKIYLIIIVFVGELQILTSSNPIPKSLVQTKPSKVKAKDLDGEILVVPKEQFLEGSVHSRILTSGTKKN